MTLRHRRVILVLLVLLAVVVGIDNMGRPLANPDEGRYSEISREMELSGDWVTPRLNGFKYFEKPPLQYWATAAVFKVLGLNEHTARMYTALCGLLTILAIFFTARRLATRNTAMLAVGVLLCSPYFMALGGIVTLDMGLTAWLTIGVCAFLLAHAGARDDRERRRWMLVAWTGIALAVLSKGLVGFVFPTAAIFLHCLVHRDWALLRRLEWVRGLAIFLAITLPWFVLVARENPEFVRFFFVHEHFERFLTTAHRRQEPWWYFLPILFAGVLPWLVALVPACVWAWKRDDPARGFPWRRFALLWSGFIVLFFSASGSKLPAYILPVFPMLALVLGDWLERTDPRRIALYLIPVILLLVVALAFGWGAPERARSAWTKELYFAARPWILGGGLVLLGGVAWAAWLLRRGRKFVPVALLVAGSLVFVDCVEDGYQALSPRQSGEGVAAAIRPWLAPDTRLYSVRYYDQTVPFYLRRTVTLVDYVDEFSLGQASEPQRAIADVERFLTDWQRPGSAIAIMQPGHYEELLRRAAVPMRLLHMDERRAVVRKP